jgi:hypothetical protein
LGTGAARQRAVAGAAIRGSGTCAGPEAARARAGIGLDRDGAAGRHVGADADAGGDALTESAAPVYLGEALRRQGPQGLRIGGRARCQ